MEYFTRTRGKGLTPVVFRVGELNGKLVTERFDLKNKVWVFYPEAIRIALGLGGPEYDRVKEAVAQEIISKQRAEK